MLVFNVSCEKPFEEKFMKMLVFWLTGTNLRGQIVHVVYELIKLLRNRHRTTKEWIERFPRNIFNSFEIWTKIKQSLRRSCFKIITNLNLSLRRSPHIHRMLDSNIIDPEKSRVSPRRKFLVVPVEQTGVKTLIIMAVSNRQNDIGLILALIFMVVLASFKTL